MVYLKRARTGIVVAKSVLTSILIILVLVVMAFSKMGSSLVRKASKISFIHKAKADIPGGGGSYPPPSTVGKATCNSADAY